MQVRPNKLLKWQRRSYFLFDQVYVSRLNLESAYTPQLVINGQYELVGSNRVEAESAIKKVLQEKSKVKLTIDNVKTMDGKLSFIVHADGDFIKTNLLAAWVQKQATMKIKAGENIGATLSHINIVRSFSKKTAAVKNEFELTVPANLVSKNWALIVLSQQNDLKITGAVVYEPVSNNP